MMTSCSLTKLFAASTMTAQTTAMKKSKIASRESFFCSGVPTLIPKKRPTASEAVSVHASAYRWGFALPSALRLTGRTLESFFLSAAAMEPISVYMPVAKTIPRARPLVTVDELYATLRRSPGPVSSSKVESASLRTGRDSPVSRASSVSKLTASTKL